MKYGVDNRVVRYTLIVENGELHKYLYTMLNKHIMDDNATLDAFLIICEGLMQRANKGPVNAEFMDTFIIEVLSNYIIDLTTIGEVDSKSIFNIVRGIFNNYISLLNTTGTSGDEVYLQSYSGILAYRFYDVAYEQIKEE